MAKVKGPLFSVTAWGTLGNCLTYQRRRGGPVVYPRTVPKIPLTDPQLAQRASVAAAVSSWGALPGASKVWWQQKAVGMAVSGYHLYIKNYLLGIL